jgi:N-acylglucosamine-6-phosphate 2-epimerase
MMDPMLQKIKGRLIVSCQAEGDSPFNNPEGVAAFAISAAMGGAAAIRSEGVKKTRRIVESVGLPVIGLKKSLFDDQSVRITGSFEDVWKMIDAGCDMIAIDGTFRERENLTGPEFIQKIKSIYHVPVMADVATPEQGVACMEAGADCVSTTLSGYTPNTATAGQDGPDIDLVASLSKRLGHRVPVVAEGRYNSPEMARQAIENGAWAVVVGTAITRPHVITKWFNDAIER